MHRRHAVIAVLLTLAVVFNTAPVFAAAVSMSEPGAHMMMAGHAHHNHNMNMPCCDDNDNTGCACMGHCASPFISQAMLMLHSMGSSIYLAMAQQMPVPYVDSPPLRPPRS